MMSTTATASTILPPEASPAVNRSMPSTSPTNGLNGSTTSMAEAVVVQPGSAVAVSPEKSVSPTEIPCSGIESTHDSGTNGISSIDTALLTAMRDSNERLALLRCEQALVEFIQNPHAQQIDIGGAYNSVVLGLSVTAGSSDDVASAGTGTTTSTGTCSYNQVYHYHPSQAVQNYGYVGSASSWDSSGGSQQVLIQPQPPQQQYGVTNTGRPTSFQRCWLHRLADRFSIARESIKPDWITCIKTEQSKIPDQLLINLDQSEYNLQDSMSNLSINGNKKSRRKMKIMKKGSSSSSNLGASDERKDKTTRSHSFTSTSSLKGKNLSDREKAYAEARARIFKSGNSVSSLGTGEGPDDKATLTCDTPPSSSSPTPDEPHTQSRLTPTTNTTVNLKDLKSRPKAATMGGISKVTWRNRQQEENDPDFQRGAYAPPPEQSYAFFAPASQYYMSSYDPSQQQQQQYTAAPAPVQQTQGQQQQQYGKQQYFVQQQQPFYGRGRSGRGRLSGRGRYSAQHRGGRGNYHHHHTNQHHQQPHHLVANNSNNNSTEDFPTLK